MSGFFTQSGYSQSPILMSRFDVFSSGAVRFSYQSSDFLTIKHFDFMVERLGDREEMGMIEAVRQRRPDAYLIYGDWLEEQGRPLAAKMVREGWIP